jgi:hypothetical protein
VVFGIIKCREFNRHLQGYRCTPTPAIVGGCKTCEILVLGLFRFMLTTHMIRLITKVLEAR